MKREYDFSKATRSKFYRANTKLNLPIYLDVASRDAASEIKIGAEMSDSASRIRALIEQKKQQERNQKQQAEEKRRNAISQAVLTINEQMAKAALPYLQTMREATEKTKCLDVLNAAAKSYQLKAQRNGNTRAEAGFWRMTAEFRIGYTLRHFNFLVDESYHVEEFKIDDGALISELLQIANFTDIQFQKIFGCGLSLAWDKRQEWVAQWWDGSEKEWVSSGIYVGLFQNDNAWNLKVNEYELEESEWSQERFEQIIASLYRLYTK